MHIRPAHPDDAAAIAAIYNHAVVHTTAIFNDHQVDAANRMDWMTARTTAGFPVLVAEQNGQVVGYASYGPWRAFDGFAETVEHSVYVAPNTQGLGIGRALMEKLIATAKSQSIHVMVAGIEAQNVGSIALHEKLGFIETARMPQVGQKFGKWLDLVFLQRILDAREIP